MNFLKKIIYGRVIPIMGKALNYKNHYINVIYYHDVVNGNGHSFMQTNIDLFKKQMQYLADNCFDTYRFDDFEVDPNLLEYKPKHILITFDDGWKSNFYEIFEFMKGLGIKYNIFLTVGKINKDPEYLTWNQIRMMHESGLVGFGAHTFNHPNMSLVENYSPDKELFKANAVIQHELGITAKDFCFPYGAYSPESIEQVIDSNLYRRVYTSDLNYTYLHKNCLIFGRNGISNDEQFQVFKNKVAGNYNIFKKLTACIHG